VELQYVTDVMRHHHERPDGRGCPDKLSGPAIPFLSSLIAVADAWDAMTTDRSYRQHLSTEEAARRMRAEVGSRFLPTAIDALFRVVSITAA
jgi:HD-GYP domain-containing protein (c-di-GMP phosphodiesterase class II)